MEWLKSLYTEVQDVIKNEVPSGWPGLQRVMEFLWTKPLCTEAMLPLASCRAVGGSAAHAVQVTAAVVSFTAALRFLDDVEVKEILETIDTKEFLIWAALKEREKALAALGNCPDIEGRMALEAYITGMFGDIDSLLLKAGGRN